MSINKYCEKQSKLNMNHDWKFHFGDIILANENTHTFVYHFSKAGGIGGPTGVDYMDHEWKNIQLPHDYAIEQPFDKAARANHGYKQGGIAWYRKSFCLPKSCLGKSIAIQFEGISGKAEIFFNGSLLKRNFSNYNSFIVDISDRFYCGDKANVIAVRVDATYWEGWWYEGAGIYGDVTLLSRSPLHIEDYGVFVNSVKQDKQNWLTNIQTEIKNDLYEAREFTLVSTLMDAGETPLAKTSLTAKCEARSCVHVADKLFVSEPALWDIEHPNLYYVVSELYSADELIDINISRFGYRTIAFSAEKGFYLNDKPVKLKGTCNHSDHAGLGVAVPYSIHEFRIRKLKEMGCNAFRSAHNTAKEILTVCDEMGLLVMEENRNFESTPEVFEQIEMMVKRARNHPCVIMYSIFNEEPLQYTEEGANIARALSAEVKRCDNTRPVIGALNGGIFSENGTIGVLDIVGINYQHKNYDEFHKRFPQKLAVGSETVSAFASRGVYQPEQNINENSNFDECYASWGCSVREGWKYVNERDFIMGTFVWTGFDYLGEPTPYVWPSVSSCFGIMDSCGFPKDTYYLYQAFWKEQPIIHIVSHWNWDNRQEPVKVMVYTNCEQAELFLNGKSLGKKDIELYEQGTWAVDFEKGFLEAKGYKNGTLVASDKVCTAGKPTFLQVIADRDYIYNDFSDAIPISVIAVDKDLNPCPNAGHLIEFAVSGGAFLLGTGNGDANSHESFKSNYRSLYNGKCQIIIGSNGENEDVKIMAKSGDLVGECNVLIKQKEKPSFVKAAMKTHLTKWKMISDIKEEKPDIHTKIDDFDMNTWETVAIDNNFFKAIENKINHYAMVRCECLINEPYHHIVFLKALGEIEVYINNMLISSNQFESPSRFVASLPDNIKETMTVTVLVKNIGGQAGLADGVYLK